jgi:hypothetical protein
MSQQKSKVPDPVKERVKGNEAGATIRRGQLHTVNVRDISMHLTVLTEAWEYMACLHYSLLVIPVIRLDVVEAPIY